MTSSTTSRPPVRGKPANGRRPAVPAELAATIPAEAQWDEAFLRVESYLRAHQIKSRVILNKLTNEIMAAARLAAAKTQEPPVTVAVRTAQARIGDWLVDTVGEGDWADERFRARGRLALLLADLPLQRPDDFLTAERLPAEMKERFASAQLQAGPEIRLRGMTSEPLEFPLNEAVEARWVTFHRSAFVRSVGVWLVFTGLAGLAWFSTR